MPRPLSQLVHFPIQTGDGTKTLMTMHGYSAFGDAVRELGLAVNPNGRVVGLQAPKGVYLGRELVGYTWLVGPLEQPSPVHYGDALQELERFFWDEVDRQERDQAELPFLIGIEQGATMALAMAAATPDLISGVIAINAVFPMVPGWEPPLAPLDGLPVLLAGDADAQAWPEQVLTGDRLADLFQRWGGIVSRTSSEPEVMRSWLAEQPVRLRDCTTPTE